MNLIVLKYRGTSKIKKKLVAYRLPLPVVKIISDMARARHLSQADLLSGCVMESCKSVRPGMVFKFVQVKPK